MKSLPLLETIAAASALLLLAASEADAQGRPAGGGPRINLPPPPPIGVFNSYPGVWVVEREVPVIVEREVPVTPPPAPPLQEEGKNEPPRKPYVIGNTYDSLPAGCMKMIEEGAAYYYCDGEWYRQEGKSYRAVTAKL